MKIGIDARLWGETGLGRYVRNIIKELTKLDTHNQYVIFMLKRDAETFQPPTNFRIVVTDIKWHSFTEQLILPLIFLKENLDILHVPHFNAPILYPKPFIVTIHDLTILRVRTGRATTLPYPIYLIKHLAFNLALFSSIKRSKHIFTVSNFVKNDIMKTFNIPETKITLTPCAAANNFYNFDKNPEAAQQVLNKYNITRPYIFYVGNAHPHKNIERLVQAFALISPEYRELQLVLGGSKKFFYERIEREIHTHPKTQPIVAKIKFIGFIDDADLPYLYNQAEMFINPSMYEGFGIQILEAFACKTRVACSNTTSLPEIGENCAEYFNPYDIQGMAQAIKNVLNNIKEQSSASSLSNCMTATTNLNLSAMQTISFQSTNTTLLDKGYEISKKYSWETSAKRILDYYKTYVSNKAKSEEPAL